MGEQHHCPWYYYRHLVRAKMLLMYTRKRVLFDPSSTEPFTLSRSKVELYTNCPRCFYMDCRYGISRPSFPPFTLNNAVDNLLKNEFDILRQKGESHELIKHYQIDAIPFSHPDLPKWRGEIPGYYYIGASFVHPATNFKLTGMVDDVWQNSIGDLLIVDYKATSTTKEISLEDEYKQAYKRQLEFYQWLFRNLGFSVSDTGYFVFANAIKDRDKFDARLEFTMSIIPYTGKTSWVEPLLLKIKTCLSADTMPDPSSDCEYCSYRKSSAELAASKK